MTGSHIHRIGVLGLILGALALAACGNGGGGGGGGSSSDGSRGRVEGTVTSSLTAGALAGATVATTPPVDGSPFTTDGTGAFTFKAPAGTYTLTVTRTNYTASTASVTVEKRKDVTRNVALAPIAPVIVSPALGGTPTPGTGVPVSAGVTILDGSSLVGVLWEQSNSVDVAISGATSANATVTLPPLSVYRDYLFHILSEPPIAEEDLPPNVHVPEEWPGGLQDRFGIQALNPFVLEHASHVTLKVTVTTSSGTYVKELGIVADLPWRVNPGINNIPVNVATLLHGKNQGSYAWSIVGPATSTAAFDDANLQNPTFTPDVDGVYVIRETVSGTVLEVYAGHWAGVISGQDGDGRPEAEACTFCHDGGLAPDNFTDWAKSGHAEILSVNLDTSTHYGSSCFPCHSVGYDTTAANTGMDDATDYGAFLGAGLLNKPGDNWTTMLANFPQSAAKANVQCESCHGPQYSLAHKEGAPRMSLSSDVCATCHGEPLRHARFQQWQLSPHANYELALDEGEDESCSRCHTVNGFLAWQPYLLADNAEAEVDVTWTRDETHPQTCVACHDPHDPGSTSGEPTNATVRIAGDTPLLLAGFRATDVGRGAICMTCHNGRRGLRNDVAYPVADYRETHAGAQSDVFMGQNLYFTAVGRRSPHANIPDSCVNCHMEKTPPPDLLAYRGGGTNHTFFASREACAECHDNFDAEGLAEFVEGRIEELKEGLEHAILGEIRAAVADGDDVYLMSGSTTVAAVVTAANVGTLAGVAEEDGGMLFGSRGGQVVSVLLGGSTVEAIRIDRIRIGATSGPTLIASANGQIIAKAGWNYFMFHADGSEGAHNPEFILDVLATTIEMVESVIEDQD